jgi:hypothetical protein
MPGKWHDNMENLFPKDMQEIKFYCSSLFSNTCRRADIRLSSNRTCEIQHSYISENEIVKRFNDWNEFGKEIIWLIDGNEGIQLDKLSSGNYLLIFKQLWKYKSFIKTYNFILLEINDLIFKIELNKIKSGMIELKEPKTLKETIDFLKTKPDKIWDFWSDENVVKSVLGVYQQGAGNGKTYGIWKSITENVDRKTYIIVTKQHSAKTVIYEELNDQKKRFENGEEMYHIENLTNNIEENTDKHYVIKYTHKKSKRECKVIIGTIDSFCFNLSNSTIQGSNFFKGIVDNIKINGATKIKNGNMKFGGQPIQLSKESEIWIDEVQDLPENYLHAMMKLMYETSCYINVVGDKLQSLEFTNNFLTNIVEEGLPNINIDINEPINQNRRIKVTNMGNKINDLINFGKYNLPIIECDKEITKENNEVPIKIFDSPIIYANDVDDDKLNKFCDTIMEKYKNEVETNNYYPNDFLIVFPIMKGNVIAPELQTKIQEYWTDKYNTIYTQYVYLHKHTAGTVINTTDSVNATRIMSIRSSKGDGRKVVFILGVTEESLKIVSNKEIGLVYESHLHVALTRAKNQIYFGVIKKNDDIHIRLAKTGYVEYLPNINKKIELDKINELINKDNFIELLNNNDINFNNIIEESKIELRETVDWGYHCIKYQTFYFNVILNIINNKQHNLSKDNSELFVILRVISNYTIKVLNVIEFYKFLNKYQYKKLPAFPLCKLSDKSEYIKYSTIIYKTMQKIQQHIKTNTIDKLNVYESIILTYMIQIETSQKYADMTPMDIYNITDYFQKNSNKEQDLLNNISNVRTIIDGSGLKEHKNINWNIIKHIELNSNYKYFKISKMKFPIIGNNETDVIHIVLKSDINKLNFWDTMIQILLERFLIYNPKLDNDKAKFKDKKINTYLFVLDKNSFVKIDWDWDKHLSKDIKNEFKCILEKYYQNYHDDIYKYFTFIKDQDSELWINEPDKIIDSIVNKCKDMKDCPDYIITFFEDINTKIEEEDDYDYVNDLVSFNKKLNKKLQIYIKKYLDT